jgi:hypothetical protein
LLSRATKLLVERVNLGGDLPAAVGLKDVEIANPADAEYFVAYVCKGFGLYFDPTNPDDPAY